MIYLWEHRPVLKVLKRYSWKESGAGRRIRSNLSPPRGGLKNCVNDFNSRISGNSVMTWIWGECAERGSGQLLSGMGNFKTQLAHNFT